MNLSLISQGLSVLIILLWRLMPSALSPIDPLPSMIRLLRITLKRLCFLRVLSVLIRTFSDVRAPIDADLKFPFLRVLQLGPMCDVDIVFLRHLSKLEDLDLRTPEISADAYIPGSFPRLTRYFGKPHHVPHIIPGSAVRFAS